MPQLKICAFVLYLESLAEEFAVLPQFRFLAQPFPGWPAFGVACLLLLFNAGLA